mmetsp:Transcript_91010/g.136332  ORF Transcript_91010/g.136332 Transcript_91010/m.136332 type:complete len:252 (-) Transcript_91010:1812-2567(-)
MKSEVAISKSSKGYSSSKVSPSSSPVAGSTWTTVNRSSHVKLPGERGASVLRSSTVKQFLLSPYRIPLTGISPEAVKTSESLSSIRTVTLSSRCSSIVFCTVNCSTTCFSKMCLTQVTTYSVSDSVRGTGGADRKARPKAASSGIAYTAAAGSTTSFFFGGSSPLIGSKSIPFSVTPPISSGVSSTMGREAKVIGSELSMDIGVLMYAFILRSSLSKDMGKLSSKAYAAVSPATGVSGGMSSASASSGGGT